MNSLPPPLSAIDPLAARLERLARRRAESADVSAPAAPPQGTSVPGMLAPPTVSTSARVSGSQAARGAGRPTSSLASPAANAGGPSSGRPVRSTRKHHPARIARVGALAMSCASAGGLAYLFAGLNTSQAADASLAALPAPVATAATTAATTTPATTAAANTAATLPAVAVPAATAAATVETPATTAATATAALTAFDGDIVNTRYGPVQIQVQITNGSISEVAVIQYPDGDGKSVRINARALPTLRSEVLSAQSANIDTVSGATYTSNAYHQSLQSAIDEARAAGVTALA